MIAILVITNSIESEGLKSLWERKKRKEIFWEFEMYSLTDNIRAIWMSSKYASTAPSFPIVYHDDQYMAVIGLHNGFWRIMGNSGQIYMTHLNNCQIAQTALSKENVLYCKPVHQTGCGPSVEGDYVERDRFVYEKIIPFLE